MTAPSTRRRRHKNGANSMDQTNTVKRTGMIGLGAMGLQFARHMLRKGFDVAGYDINADAVRRAENDGIRHRTSPAEIGKFAEVVVVMVATDAQVESVVEGSGLIDALAPGSVICIASSVAPETCRRLAALAAAKNIGVLDTPVVLGQEAADNGTCTVYVGGEERWLERARPVLQAFGRDVVHLGDVGSGQIAKMINNMLLWATMVANFEALTLASNLAMTSQNSPPRSATARAPTGRCRAGARAPANGPRRTWTPRWSWRRPPRSRCRSAAWSIN